MPDPKRYDLEFRPETYWPGDDTRNAILRRIKGAARREVARKVLDGELPLCDAQFLAESLSPAERRLVGAIHPSLMGGEYLPDLHPGEVEIARLEMASILRDVTSIRARRVGGRIRYAIVDEYLEDRKYRIPIASSREPLSFRELLRLIAGAALFVGGERMYEGLIAGHWYFNIEDCGADFESYIGFYAMDSDFYPDLGRWYAEFFEELIAGQIGVESIDWDPTIEDPEDDDDLLSSFVESEERRLELAQFRPGTEANGSDVAKQRILASEVGNWAFLSRSEIQAEVDATLRQWREKREAAREAARVAEREAARQAGLRGRPRQPQSRPSEARAQSRPESLVLDEPDPMQPAIDGIEQALREQFENAGQRHPKGSTSAPDGGLRALYAKVGSQLTLHDEDSDLDLQEQ